MIIQHSEILICEFSSTLSKIREVEALLDKVNQNFALRHEVMHKCRICLIEAVNNALIHGNHLNKLKTVIVTCLKFKNYIRFSVKDEGKGFNFNRFFNKNLERERLLEPSGRGIFFIRHFSDRVQFLDRGRIIQLDFFL